MTTINRNDHVGVAVGKNIKNATLLLMKNLHF